MAMALVQAQVDEGLKREAEAVLAERGLTVSGLVQTLLTRIAREKAVPFDAKQDTPDEEELAERRKAVDFARVNVELEGFKIAPECETLAEQYITGEIDLDRLRKDVLKQIGVKLNE
jgi:DNA-damage-inducible protein J